MSKANDQIVEFSSRDDLHEIGNVAGAGLGMVGDKTAFGASMGFASTGTFKGAVIGGTAGFGSSVLGGDHGKAGRVICTHFYRKGRLDAELWRSDLEFTFKYLSPKTIRGYQYWAIPYVRLMRRSPLAEKIVYPMAIWRAEELAYKMGKRKKGNWKGKLVRFLGEPVCFMIGHFVGEQNWQQLWADETLISNS